MAIHSSDGYKLLSVLDPFIFNLLAFWRNDILAAEIEWLADFTKVTLRDYNIKFDQLKSISYFRSMTTAALQFGELRYKFHSKPEVHLNVRYWFLCLWGGFSSR